jgi:hypothetical protein
MCAASLIFGHDMIGLYGISMNERLANTTPHSVVPQFIYEGC